MTTKSQEWIRAFAAKVEEENERFRKLRPNHKRVVIALDALAQLRAGFLRARAGTYFEATCASRPRGDDQTRGALLDVPSCTVCGIGGVFVATIMRTDRFKVKNLNVTPDGARSVIRGAYSQFFDYLTKLFPYQDLSRVEQAFEGWFISGVDPSVSQIWSKIANHKTRLRLILENIVANGGSFDPEILPKRRGARRVTPGFHEAKIRALALLGAEVT